MKIERTKNATKNIIFVTILRVYQIFVPFALRTAIIYFLGIQYLGLNSLFSSILQVLNLAELGVGSAMVFSMYKPIAEDDEIKINALMLLYKQYYLCIGAVILIVGGAITPFIPKLITGEVPENINVYTLYWIQLVSTVMSYWLFAYKNSLLSAHQRTDVISKITIIINTITYILQFLILVFFKNYYLYVLVIPIMQIINNLLTAVVVGRMYPKYKATGNLDDAERKTINQRVRDVFTAKLGGVVVGSADTIVISAFLGLTTLAIYQNYFYIVSAILGFINVLNQACTAGIGNSFVTENLDKNFNDLKKLTVIYMMIANFAACCFLNLFQPFMELWVGKELMLNYGMVILFTVYFVAYECMSLFSLYKDASGMWHQDRYRPLFEALLNFSLNLLMVKRLGLYGILLSTIISMAFFSIPWLVNNLFKYVFKRDSKEYAKLIFKNIGVMLLSTGISYMICSRIDLPNISELLVKLFISGAVAITIYIALFRNSKLFLESMQLLNMACGGRTSIFIDMLSKKR